MPYVLDGKTNLCMPENSLKFLGCMPSHAVCMGMASASERIKYQ